MLIPELPTPHEGAVPAASGSGEEPRVDPATRSPRPTRQQSCGDQAALRRRLAGSASPISRAGFPARSRAILIDTFLIEEAIGVGGMGAVFSRSRYQARPPGRAQAVAPRSGRRHRNRPPFLPGGAIGGAARSREYRACLQHRPGWALSLHRIRIHRGRDRSPEGRDLGRPPRRRGGEHHPADRLCTCARCRCAGWCTAISSPRISSSRRREGPSSSTWGWPGGSSAGAIMG